MLVTQVYEVIAETLKYLIKSLYKKALVTEVYEDSSGRIATRFLTDDGLKGFPFDVKEIQVDGGSKFFGATLNKLTKIIILNY